MSNILPSLIERFFTQWLMRQRNASPHTVAAYRDTFRLLLRFAHRRTGKRPSALSLGDLDADLIVAFLDHLADDRAASAATSNLRLTGVRAFFRFLAFEEPAHSGQIQRVLAIPSKLSAKREVSYLLREEIEAILAAPDRSTWLGRRDHALLLMAVQTGLRLSELVSLDRDAVQLGAGAHVRCLGKGRKERATPLTQVARVTLQAWLGEPPRRGSTALFPTVHGDRLSPDAVQYLLSKYLAAVSAQCPSLARKRVSPHVLRHSAAMALLDAGVDTTTISLWLGHESTRSTQPYLHAHLAVKEAALAKVAPLDVSPPGRFRPDDQLLAFLDAL
ncbi:tyrosine-type recombinase/integrase [Marinivivus vitaminiproducens]|uniref:tyrosine-type recombinase/integrase n=1 Tax=Marinivivus vitaminiproducens TaxID=3035935 RepID=UPI00279F5712|nr:tyrosine-type recombinase/integrase [Geminicoccaceae bacterium SCSIO 64248]